MHTGASGAAAVGRLMRPRSVAIIGISSQGRFGRADGARQPDGQRLRGRHSSGRTQRREIDGRPVRQSVDELPEGVDLAVFTLPAAGVKEALDGCVRRKVRAAVVFSSGFAEVSEDMRPAQEELSKIARAGDVALLGPELPWLHQLRRRLHCRICACRGGAACCERTRSGARGDLAERRLHGPLAPSLRRARPADLLHDLARQRGRPRPGGFHRVPH